MLTKGQRLTYMFTFVVNKCLARKKVILDVSSSLTFHPNLLCIPDGLILSCYFLEFATNHNDSF